MRNGFNHREDGAGRVAMSYQAAAKSHHQEEQQQEQQQQQRKKNEKKNEPQPDGRRTAAGRRRKRQRDGMEGRGRRGEGFDDSGFNQLLGRSRAGKGALT